MSTISLPLSIVTAFQPQVINGIACDGIVDGRPVTIRRNRYNGLVPAIGSTFKSTYGTAQVVGYDEGALKARIIEFDENYEFETKDVENPDILTAEECVEGLSRCANASIESVASDLRRIHRTDAGNVPPKIQDAIARLGYYDTNEYRCYLTDAYEYLTGDCEVLVDHVHSYLIEKETPKERNARIKAERELAIKRANALLAEYDADEVDCPDDVAAEIAEEMGDLDVEF
jgi:hypothetical protein